MRVIDFIRTIPPPPWLQEIWSDAKLRGLHRLTDSKIDAEITAQRRISHKISCKDL
jgi:hypothetical protein